MNDGPLKEQPCFIYEITHTASGTIYVGISVNPTDRFGSHRKQIKGSTNVNLSNAIGLYGIEAFTFEVLYEYPTKEEAGKEETRIIHFYRSINQPIYNIADGGECPPSPKGRPSPKKGKPLSEEVKKRMADAQKGKRHSEESKKKMSEAQKAKKWKPTIESRKKISEALKGRASHLKGKKLSEEHISKMSAARKGKPGKPHSEEHKRRMSLLMKGKPRSEETRKKISEANKRRAKTRQQDNQ